jgi:hypothetical protein
MPSKWNIYKGGRAGNKKMTTPRLASVSEIPSLPSADSQPGYFHTSLSCKPSSLIRVSLGWFDYSTIVMKGNPTPAYSPVSDRRRLTALFEVQLVRRVQTPTPRISGSNLQKNHIIEARKEEKCDVSSAVK